MAQNSFGRGCLIALLLASVYFTFLGSARLWDRDEPRNSRASHEMLARGDWIVPTFNGELRDHKPILLYWGQMVAYLGFGESEFSARLPSTFCAALAVLAIVILGSRLSGRKTGISADGLWAGAALGTSMLFVMAGRAATPDACLIAFSTLGIACLVASSLRGAAPYSAGAVGPARWRLSMLGYAMLGVAVLAKGPVGLILPAAVVHVWWLICARMTQVEVELRSSTATRQPRSTLLDTVSHWLREAWFTFNPLSCVKAVWQLKLLPGFFVCALVAVPWYYAVGVATDGAFLRGFFWDHNVGRAVSSMEGHSGSIFFYPIAFMAGTFPWSLWLIPILLWARKAGSTNVVQRQMLVLAATWIGIYVTAFSIASTKLPSYITPCYAGAALAVGAYLRQFESGWSLPSMKLRSIAYGITMLVGMLIAAAIIWISNDEAMHALRQAGLAGGAIVVMALCAVWWEFRGQSQRVPLTWFCGAVAFNVLLFGHGAKVLDSYRSDLQMVVAEDQAEPESVWLTVGGMEPSWVHYLGKQIVEVRTHPAEEQTWDRVRQFLADHQHGKVLVVGEEAEVAFRQRFEVSDGISSPAMNGQVELVSTSPRFLRDGSMSIYRVPERPVANDRLADPMPGGLRVRYREMCIGQNSKNS